MIKKADIILIGGAENILAKAISVVLNFFQTDPVDYTHVLIAKNESEGIEAKWRVMNCSLGDKLSKAKRYKIIRLKSLTDDERDKIIKSIECLIGIKYSISRLLLQLLDQISDTNFFTKLNKSKENQICSSLVAWGYYVYTKTKFNGVDWKSCEPDDIDDESQKNTDMWEIIEVK